MSNALAKLSRIRTALEAAKSIDEMIDLRDQAAAVATYAKASRLSLENVNAAMEVKLRTERKAGELLRGMGLHAGRKGNGCTMQPLEDLGIAKHESHRWQTMAAVGDEAFDEFISTHQECRRELTSKALYSLGKKTLALASAEPEREPSPDVVPIANVIPSLEHVKGQRFGCIYADPPWKYGNQATRASTDNHYGTMTVDELCEMPVADLAAPDSHLHLWTTNAFLPESFRVMAAWGFEYRSVFVWVKPQMGIGNYWRVSHEFLLLGIRGNAKRFNVRNLTSWASIPRRNHSAKPDEIRQMIERASNGPFLEMFGRQAIPGWTVMGNQIEERLFA